MPKIVQIPNVGNVEFPDSMSDEQISAAIRQNMQGTKLPQVTSKVSAAPKRFTLPWLKENFYNAADEISNTFPAVGAGLGAILGGTAGSAAPGAGTIAGGIGGAGIGGMGGEAARQLTRRALGFESPQTSQEAANQITREGMLQSTVQGAGELLPFLAPALKRAAVGQYERALAPTTRANKAITQDIVPELIERRQSGSLQGLEKRATARARALSPELNTEYQQLQQASPTLPVRNPASGQMMRTTTGQVPGSGNQVISDLEKLKQRFLVPDAAGQLHPGNQQAMDAIEGVQETVRQYGPNIPPNSLRQLKQIFDEPVAAAGGYADKSFDFSTHYTLNAQEAAANSIRKILHNASPDIAGLDREISFWLDVQRVTRASGLRRTGQEGGLMKVMAPLGTGLAGGAGLAIGGPKGSLEAGAATALSVLAIQMIRSPAWRTASAVMKDRLAGALARGSVSDVATLAARFGLAATQRMSRGAQSNLQSIQQEPQ